MTREEILQMDEATLFIEVTKFVQEGNDEPQFPYFLDDKLAICYQAEEKVKEAGLWRKYGDYLLSFLDNVTLGNLREGWGGSYATLAHLHPKQRAQAVLLTVEEMK